MEDAFTIGKRLKEEAEQALENNLNDASWHKLRSDVYLRDKGICWVCNTFVELKDYDLGHIVDRCMGGKDIIGNLTVMRKSCNLSKPKHATIEEAMQWKLNPPYLSERPLSMFDDTKSIYKPPTNNHYPKKQLPLKNTINYTPPNIDNDNFHKVNHHIEPNKIKATGILENLLYPNPEDRKVIPLIPQIIEEPFMTPSRVYKPRTRRLPKLTYQDILSRIKPATLCWIQGRPQGGAMWRVLPPPYTKEDGFVIRITPPGAIEPITRRSGIKETLQVIGGKLTEEVTVEIGIFKIIITPDGDRLQVKFKQTNKSNSRERNHTVGWGNGQIPIRAWKQARAKGISFNDFMMSYWDTKLTQH